MKNTQELAQKIIREMFNKLRLNFLGPQYIDKSVPYVLDNFDPSTTLGSLYTHALSQNAIHPDAVDAETLNTLNITASSLVDKLQENILHEIDTTFNMHMNEVNVKSKIAGKPIEDILNSDAGKEIKDKVGAQLKFIFNKMNNGIDRIVVNESHNAQTYGAMDGIMHMSQSVGISDPVIAKRGIIDENMCKFCRQLWHTESNINIPKVYKMSELQGGYMDRKDPQATMGMTHPHCRHVIVSVMPGFGFDDGGKLIYKGRDENGELWDEYKHQRS